ncbi:hypothetical protein ZIOFF_031904 [Zingiber officinale]|uniref:Uncharacterized protein n=1 Tax=Zingiber officinale TaxID=94328 RepID=A0A8J5GN03_ZINOF|nr:hypothetical protein ZIOFF_031904 [Zingiber officinale]
MIRSNDGKVLWPRSSFKKSRNCFVSSLPTLLTIAAASSLALFEIFNPPPTLLHFLLLAFNIISVKSLSVVSGGDKSIFSKNENARAVIIVSSQVSKSYALVSMSVTSQCTHVWAFGRYN